MPALLEIDDLATYFYTETGVVKAVDHVTLKIEEGKTLGIVGESGSGKELVARRVNSAGDQLLAAA